MIEVAQKISWTYYYCYYYYYFIIIIVIIIIILFFWTESWLLAFINQSFKKRF